MEPTASAAAVPLAVLRLAAVGLLVLAGIALLPLGRRIPAGAVRRWCRWIVRAAGVRVRIAGAAVPTGGVLLVANHISWLDVPLLAAVRPARMLAKTEIRRWPVAGALAARGGVLFIDRDRLRALPDTVAALAGILRGGAAARRSRRSRRGAPGAAGPGGTFAARSSRRRWTPGSRYSRCASVTGVCAESRPPHRPSSVTTRSSPRCGA